MYYLEKRSLDSSVGRSTGYGLDGRGSRHWQDFSILHKVQTSSGAYPASCQMGTGNHLPGCKAAGCGADHSPPSSAEVKNGGAYLHSPRSLWHSA
jgi:hypothetical protein